MALAFFQGAWLNWMKWGDPIVDTGQALEIPRRLAEGEVLYRDLRYYYGPLAPYLNACAYKLFGVHVYTLIGMGLASTALLSFLLYRLARLFVDRLGASAATVAVLFLCVFGSYIPNGGFNFVLPYTFTATYGLLAALASLFFLIKHARKERPRDYLLAAGFLGLTALTKLEILFALALAHACFLAGAGWERRLRWKLHAGGLGLAAGVALLGYAPLGFTAGWGVVADNVLALVGSRFQAFTRFHMGLDRPESAGLAILLSAALLGACAGGVALLARLGRSERARPALRRALALPAAALGVALYAGLGLEWFGLDAWVYMPALELPFRVLPWLALGVWTVLAWRFARQPESRAEALPELLLWTFAGALLGRLAFNAHAYHFGFFMLPPGLLVLAVFWFRTLNRWSGGASGWLWRAGGLGMLLGLACGHLPESILVQDQRTVELSGPRGSLYALRQAHGVPVGEYYRATLELLKKLPPGSRVLALPEGAALTFLAGHPMPYGIYHFLPSDLVGDYAEDRLLARFEAEPPDVIVRVAFDLSEYGVRGFGVDYAPRCGAWIKEHYRAWQSIGAPGDDTILILKRRDAPDPVPEDRLRGAVEAKALGIDSRNP
ncbi:MAG: glycosyltransferase family 39 protein [Planctomycetota bacterium]|nr:glycosyltransferase family 39 protein [Planctomycetota bacterium]